MIVAEAPGKVLLAGEYAVLLPGEPCLVAAVDRTLRVEAVPSSAWSARAAGVEWRDGEPVPEGLSFVVAAIAAALARWDVGPFALATRDALHEGGHKLGLGGSAAVTVATLFAIAPGHATREELWAIADEVHRATQGGKGSGADVAASVHGGVLRYVREPRAATPVAVARGITPLLVWTGASVKTAPRLERWRKVVAEDPATVERFALESRRAVELLEGSMSSGDFAGVRGAMAQARAALKGLESALGLELETDALRRAADVAWRAGACGKLSGAGGGDCAIVLADGDAGAARAKAALEGAGLEVFPIGFARGGVRVERG